MTNFIQKLTLSVFFICTSLSVFSAQLPSNISSAQIEQFKSLSPTQQKALASSMGVDLSSIQSQINKSSSSNKNEPTELEQYTPRETNNDKASFDIKDEKKVTAFGYDVFANAPSSFAPINDVAIPESYIIGTGDTLNIKVFGKENDEYEMPVSREGKVIIPRLGAYNVSGMTFSEAKAYLRNEIQKKVIGVEVVITLSELRSIRVFVLGEAFKPGNYLLNSLSTVTHAIFTAGGISDIGSLRNIQVKRAGKLVQTVDLYDLLIKGDSSKDIMLKSGDVVFVASVGSRVTVEGEVKRPAIYELTSNETIGEVLSMAGGLLPSAYASSTIIERYNEKSLRSIINVDLSSSSEKSKNVKAGDVIRIMKSSETFQQSISIIGAVSRPGIYQWKSNQRISDLIPSVQADLLEDADLTYSLVIRQSGLGRDIEVHQFSLKKALANYNSEDNLILKPLDKLLVFSNQDVVTNKVNTLSSLVMTEDELLNEERSKAKERFSDKEFWLEFGEQQFDDEYDPLNEKSELDELKPRELSFFSRQRLLLPVIRNLTQQAASNNSVQIVDVAGAVKYPGSYPLPVNGHIKDLIAAAGGLSESAFLGNAELSRNDLTHNEVRKELIAINLKDALSSTTDNILLKSRDRLNVNKIPYWQEEQVVSLNGEFRFPGKYIVRRGETLSQLIDRAGGLTDYADLNATLFTRESLKRLESKNILDVTEELRREIATKTLSQRSGGTIDYEQVNDLLNDLIKVKPIGRLVINLPSLLSGKSNNITMENGDSIFVASKRNTINVVGQVQVAGSHLYENNLTHNDYIKLSGGLKIQADEDRVYVIKANGAVHIPESSNWFASNNNEIKPGDTVVVPLDTYFMEDITLWQTVTQIIYQSAIAVAAITGL
ncbi:SLBB domain-containing protein [Pseudocolwellia sp. HL-MZ7]|uniref:SLBB domain-containing protein n=1 Tax=Pseudocolwellia sp. HL-MZ7 TaxID=3400627 RepID=UPI003CF08788